MKQEVEEWEEKMEELKVRKVKDKVELKVKEGLEEKVEEELDEMFGFHPQQEQNNKLPSALPPSYYLLFSVSAFCNQEGW